MNFELVETLTEQNIKLYGCLSKNNNKSCILFIPGLAGNFFETRFARNIGEESIKKGYDFLFSHNQGSFQMMDLPFVEENGKIKYITRGAAYEKFEDSFYDIDAWIKYLENSGYEDIIVVCHSLGCNKIVYYLSKKTNSSISKVILLAPQDITGFNDLDVHKGLFDEAINNINSGNPNKLLSKKFLTFCTMSSRFYYNIITNPLINNLPYRIENGNFSLLDNIDKPLYILIGTKDGGEKSLEYMKIVSNHCKNSSYDVIKDADHNFKNKEDELCDKIFNYLKNSN